MKEEPNSVDWVVALYFAEVFGRKYYFCCRLDPNENGIDPCIIEMSVNMLQYSYHLYDMLLLPGECYACKGQGVEDLQHPVTGGFESGLSDVPFGSWYE
jgi:hypothetical protein